jgi:hypothetical protein
MELTDTDGLTIDSVTLGKIFDALTKVAALDEKIEGVRMLLDTQTTNLQGTVCAIKNSILSMQAQLTDIQSKDSISRSECDQIRVTCCEKQDKKIDDIASKQDTKINDIASKRGLSQGVVIAITSCASLVSLILGSVFGQMLINAAVTVHK